MKHDVLMYYIDTQTRSAHSRPAATLSQIGTDIVHQAFFKTEWRDSELNPNFPNNV